MTYISEEDTEKIVLEHMDHRFDCGKPEPRDRDGKHCLPFQLAMDSLKFLSVLRLANKNTKRAREMLSGAYGDKWELEDKIFALKDLERYVDGGVIAWEMVKNAITLDSNLRPSDDGDREVRPKDSA